MKALRAAVLAALAATFGPGGAVMAQQPQSATVMEFSQLRGWEDDNHAAALRIFLQTCPLIEAPDWVSLCALGVNQRNAKLFFEAFFRPVLIEDGREALFTGYFEPELQASPTRSARFRYPLYRKPEAPADGAPWPTRQEIEEGALLDGQGLELAWTDDPVALFFLQIQGSGRLRLPGGKVMRVGYGGANGHPYRSVGEEMIRRGLLQPHEASAQAIAEWVRRNPSEGRALLWHNPSYVFFREIEDLDAAKGPLGAMNRPITRLRSIAVDPGFIPLGAPVWIEKRAPDPLNRLMIAQDTGSAIKGAQRADIFYGTGDAAGRAAGTVRDGGRLMVLLPVQRAYALAEEANP